MDKRINYNNMMYVFAFSLKKVETVEVVTKHYTLNTSIFLKTNHINQSQHQCSSKRQTSKDFLE